MIVVYYLLAILLIWLSFRSFLNGVRWLKYVKAEYTKPLSAFTPFATVIAPCRGLDLSLKLNLLPLIQQDYPQYEVLFVVDDINDASVPVIQDVIARSDVDCKLVIAERATISSQKVENLREAVTHASKRSAAFVFVDSDVRVPRNWLARLVSELEDSQVGATTGYRWFMSERWSFSGELRSVWNASVASALGPTVKSNFCWGGSTAIRRSTFEDLDIRERWHGALSDDFVMTQTLNDVGLRIAFVPQALVPSIGECTAHEMLEFTTRQMKITRVCSPRLWANAMIGSAIFLIVVIISVLLMVLDPDTVHKLAGLAAIVLVSAFSVGKAWLRLIGVRIVLSEYNRIIRRQLWSQLSLWPLSPAIFFYNSIAAMLSGRIVWRGITYELKSPTETVIIAPK